MKEITPKKRKYLMIWKDIKGYEGLYLISNHGDVLSLPKVVKTKNKHGEMVKNTKVKILKSHLRGSEGLLYPAVTLTKNNKHKAYSLHRLVAEAFIPNPNNLPEVNHIDKNTLNCDVSNLEWCDHQYNIEYSKNKAVEQYLDGEKIAEYKSIKYASQMTGILRTAINNALTGYSKVAGGYEWKYKQKERGVMTYRTIKKIFSL